MEFVSNQKGGLSLLHGGYRYTKIRKGAAGMVYMYHVLIVLVQEEQ